LQDLVWCKLKEEPVLDGGVNESTSGIDPKEDANGNNEPCSFRTTGDAIYLGVTDDGRDRQPKGAEEAFRWVNK
jgi:hypothetical protein